VPGPWEEVLLWTDSACRDTIKNNGIYTSTCSRYLLKEERTWDGLFFLSKYQCISPARLCGFIPATWIYSDLPASINKRLKRRRRMTSAKAREQLALCIAHLHLPEDSFSIRNRHLVSSNNRMNYPIRMLIAIIPAHGTVLAVTRRG